MIERQSHQWIRYKHCGSFPLTQKKKATNTNNEKQLCRIVDASLLIQVDTYADKICMMFHNTTNDNSHSILPIMRIHIHFV